MDHSQVSHSDGENGHKPERLTTKVKKKLMLEMLKKAKGLVSLAADNAGISRRTHELWVQKDQKYKEQYEDILYAGKDFAESKLLINVNAGISSDIQFYLRKKAPERGYGDKGDIIVKQSVSISEPAMFNGFDNQMNNNLDLAENDAELNDSRSQL